MYPERNWRGNRPEGENRCFPAFLKGPAFARVELLVMQMYASATDMIKPLADSKAMKGVIQSNQILCNIDLCGGGAVMRELDSSFPECDRRLSMVPSSIS
jgi:hypothetical protein